MFKLHIFLKFCLEIFKKQKKNKKNEETFQNLIFTFKPFQNFRKNLLKQKVFDPTYYPLKMKKQKVFLTLTIHKRLDKLEFFFSGTLIKKSYENN